MGLLGGGVAHSALYARKDGVFMWRVAPPVICGTVRDGKANGADLRQMDGPADDAPALRRRVDQAQRLGGHVLAVAAVSERRMVGRGEDEQSQR